MVAIFLDCYSAVLKTKNVVLKTENDVSEQNIIRKTLNRRCILLHYQLFGDQILCHCDQTIHAPAPTHLYIFLKTVPMH